MSDATDREAQADTGRRARPAPGTRPGARPATTRTASMPRPGGRSASASRARRTAGGSPRPDRADPIAILEAQGASRVPELVPIRYGRMAVSPFTFYRGAAAVMAADLAAQPRTSLKVQLCGDAHLSNFGIYMSPERNLVFDLNDFDETLAGSVRVGHEAPRGELRRRRAGRSAGRASFSQRAVMFAMGSYRLRMAEYAGMGALDTWYSRITIEDLRSLPAPRAARHRHRGRSPGSRSRRTTSGR